MDKKEFLEKLTIALAGQVSRQVIEENVNYYDNYISEEIRKGRPVGQVLEELGDPRLLARSIIDAHGGGSDMAGVYEDSEASDGYGYRSSSDEDPFENRQRQIHQFRMGGFWALLVLAALLICVIMVVGTVLGGIFLLLRPILVPLLIIFLIYSLIKGRGRY